jgi:hypothetical protein
LLQEYLKRSDTAIIFPEPVEQGTWIMPPDFLMKLKSCAYFQVPDVTFLNYEICASLKVVVFKLLVA